MLLTINQSFKIFIQNVRVARYISVHIWFFEKASALEPFSIVVGIFCIVPLWGGYLDGSVHYADAPSIRVSPCDTLVSY